MLLWVSDKPVVPEGVKTGVGDRETTERYAADHLMLQYVSPLPCWSCR